MKPLLDLVALLQIKKDPKLLIYACLVTLLLFGLTAHGDITVKQAIVYLGLALVSPALPGLKPKSEEFAKEKDGQDDDDDGNDPPSGSRMKATVDDPAPAAKLETRPVDRRGIFPFVAAALGIFLMVWFAAMNLACSSLKSSDVKDAKDVTKTTLTILQQACVAANAFLPKTTIAKACKIAEPYMDLIDDAVSVARSSGAAAGRPYPVTCEETAAGIVCGEPYVEEPSSP